ncbi:hypothetical protein BJV77DRAFT_205745 [Russula vinacea]|nr:hypothetical protein BJV77DRAFT_205745 [Russula vinacea]
MKAAAPAVSSSASASGSRTPVGEDWMLDCEICHRSGINKVNGCAQFPQRYDFAHTWKLQDDGSPLLCCGKCSKWQHITCHDLADRKAGRPKRDWDKEELSAATVRTVASRMAGRSSMARHLHPSMQAEPPVLTTTKHLAMLDKPLTAKTTHILIPDRHTNNTLQSRSRTINPNNADLRRPFHRRTCRRRLKHLRTRKLTTARTALLPS